MTISQRCEKSAHSLCAMATCACVCHESEPTGGVADVMALHAKSEGYGSDFAADTAEPYEALNKRVNFLSSRILEMEEKAMTQEQQAPKTMRIRVNTSRTAKGYSTDATVEVSSDGVDWRELGQRLEEIVLERQTTVMAKLDAKYPREA